jgi:hypothetical protein
MLELEAKTGLDDIALLGMEIPCIEGEVVYSAYP